MSILRKFIVSLSIILVLICFNVHAEAADSMIDGGASKNTATVIPKFNVSYASELKTENENHWFCFTTNSFDAYYSIYTKKISISPASIGGHTQGIHIHVYTAIGEEVARVDGIYENGEGNTSIKLDNNTTYYINAHAGGDLSCNSEAVGYYRLEIDCKQDSISNEKTKAEPILTDTEYINSLDGTGDDDWYSFSTGNYDKYNIYLKNVGLSPSAIGGHAQCIHLHLYSEIGENLYNMYVLQEDISASVELEKNRKYYVLLHSGLTSWAGCGGKGNSEATGNYIFNIFESKNYSKYCIHEYDTSVIAPTYFKKGYTIHTCAICGHSYKDDYTAKRALGQGYLYSNCSAGKGKLYLSWSTISDATGYQIRYSTDKKFNSGVMTKTVKGQYTIKKTISNLARKKKYYVQIRPYVKSGSKIAYGKWSSKRVLKTK